MGWRFKDPEQHLQHLAGIADDEAKKLAIETLRAVLGDPYHADLTRPLRGVEKGDDLDVRVAFLSDAWTITYEIHPEITAAPSLDSVLLVLAVREIDFDFDW